VGTTIAVATSATDATMFTAIERNAVVLPSNLAIACLASQLPGSRRSCAGAG
jgi:hypothetical protein